MSAQDFKKYSDRFSYYNLGCGHDLKPSPFLNIDFDERGPKEDLVEAPGKRETFFLNYDLCDGIPAPDNSLEVIYQSHFLEHVTFKKGLFLLQECFRVLKPGGRMRLLVPDLQFWIDAYTKKHYHIFESYMKLEELRPMASVIQTPGLIFNSFLHDHGHKAVYDFESLLFLLTNFGFKEIHRTCYNDGNIGLHDYDILVNYEKLRMQESLCIECVKPKG